MKPNQQKQIMIDGFLKRKITLHLDFKTKSQARGVKNHFPYNLKI